MSQLIKRQLYKIDKKESKIISKKPNKLFAKKISPTLDNLESKIPIGLKDKLDVAFILGFKMVFEKGTSNIEKTYDKERIDLEFKFYNKAMEAKPSKKYLKAIEKNAKKRRFTGKIISVAEGAGLGILGIGMPDIPIFIGVILRGIYETSASYGFDYETDKEKIYILRLIRAAIKEENKLLEDQEVEQWRIEMNKENSNGNIEEEIQKTAKAMSQNLLIAKFIQGIPIVGITGSFFNYSMYNKISNYAGLKYKKRYLLQKL